MVTEQITGSEYHELRIDRAQMPSKLIDIPVFMEPGLLAVVRLEKIVGTNEMCVETLLANEIIRDQQLAIILAKYECGSLYK